MADFSRYSPDRSEKWCKDCERILPVDRFRLRWKRSGPKPSSYVSNLCRQCETTHVVRYRRTTAEGVAAEIVRRIKHRASRDGVPFDLTKLWVQSRLEAQQWCCALTGMPLACRVNGRASATAGYQWDSISVDRIEPSLGYTQANVRFVLNIINLFKHSGDDARMYEVAEALLAWRQKARVA